MTASSPKPGAKLNFSVPKAGGAGHRFTHQVTGASLISPSRTIVRSVEPFLMAASPKAWSRSVL